MRIKKDKSNWNASSITTRDARHDRSFDGVTGPPSKKKNKKKWCKGHEGRKHVLMVGPSKYAYSLGIGWWEIKCANCNKQFEYVDGSSKKYQEKRIEELYNKLYGDK